jgi:hypothetical protein
MNNPLQTINPENLKLTAETISAFSPIFFVIIGSLIMTLAATISGYLGRKIAVLLSLVTLIGGLIQSFAQFGLEPVVAFNGMIVMDSFGAFFCALFCGTALLS